MASICSTEEFRHGHQPERVARGCSVDNNAVVTAVFHPRGNLQKGHQLVETGQREVQKAVDFFFLQKGSAQRDLPELVGVFLLEAVKIVLRVEFEHFQVFGRLEIREAVSEGVRRVGGNEKQR
jgi:hypothetical protein